MTQRKRMTPDVKKAVNRILAEFGPASEELRRWILRNDFAAYRVFAHADWVEKRWKNDTMPNAENMKIYEALNGKSLSKETIDILCNVFGKTARQLEEIHYNCNELVELQKLRPLYLERVRKERAAADAKRLDELSALLVFDDETKSLNESIGKLNEAHEKAKSEFDEMQKRLAGVTRQVKALEGEQLTKSHELNELNKKIDESIARIKKLEHIYTTRNNDVIAIEQKLQASKEQLNKPGRFLPW